MLRHVGHVADRADGGSHEDSRLRRVAELRMGRLLRLHVLPLCARPRPGQRPLSIILMSTSPHHPAEVIPCKPEYSFRTDIRVNAWLLAALLISVTSDILFVRQIASWSMAVRVALGLAPLVAAVFWIRSVMRWIDGMD